MDHIGDNAPYPEVSARIDMEGLVLGVFGFQRDLPFRKADPFYCELPIDDGDDDFPIRRLEGSVYDKDIPFMDAGPFHRVAIDPDKESGRRVLNQVFIEVEILFEIIFGGRGKPGLNGYCKKRELHST